MESEFAPTLIDSVFECVTAFIDFVFELVTTFIEFELECFTTFIDFVCYTFCWVRLFSWADAARAYGLAG